MVPRTLLFGTVLSLLAIPLEAQDPTLLVENARVIVGDGTVFERGTVVVAGAWINSVTDEPVEAPDARRIDTARRRKLPRMSSALLTSFALAYMVSNARASYPGS